MKIEHIALYVKDLEGAKDFFIKYFEGCGNNKYHNQSTGFKSYFITFENGARLELMNSPVVTAKNNIQQQQYGYAHLAFSVGSKENVDALTEKLRSDGYSVLSETRTTGDGYYESCIADLEGNRIEITI